MTNALEVESLQKSYGDVFFGLLGPNGAGKTTFINVLVGLVRATGGEARVFGHDVEADYREARDRIGLAPQEFNVDRFFPIHEVLEHKAGYHGVPREEATARAERALEQVGIYDKRNTRFDWLKRRFMIARALVTDPDLLILDEPSAGVDVQLRRDLWNLVTELNEAGTTVLLTTHYIEEAERLCDEVAILDGGQVRTVASPDELMDRGADRVVVTLRDPPTSRAALEAAVPTDDRIEAVDVDDDRITVTARQGGLVAPDLVRALDEAAYGILDMEIERTSLEEVFVEMTRPTGQDAGDGALATGDDATEVGGDAADDDRSATLARDGGTR
jgi:ABC-2 type transport system ATP-binding protein